jgi:hypothetical protein
MGILLCVKSPSTQEEKWQQKHCNNCRARRAKILLCATLYNQLKFTLLYNEQLRGMMKEEGNVNGASERERKREMNDFGSQMTHSAKTTFSRLFSRTTQTL